MGRPRAKVRQGLSADPEAALLHRLEVPAVGEECPLYQPSPPDPSTATLMSGPSRLGDRLCCSDGDRVRVDSCGYI